MGKKKLAKIAKIYSGLLLTSQDGLTFMDNKQISADDRSQIVQTMHNLGAKMIPEECQGFTSLQQIIDYVEGKF